MAAEGQVITVGGRHEQYRRAGYGYGGYYVPHPSLSTLPGASYHWLRDAAWKSLKSLEVLSTSLPCTHKRPCNEWARHDWGSLYGSGAWHFPLRATSCAV